MPTGHIIVANCVVSKANEEITGLRLWRAFATIRPEHDAAAIREFVRPYKENVLGGGCMLVVQIGSEVHNRNSFASTKYKRTGTGRPGVSRDELGEFLNARHHARVLDDSERARGQGRQGYNSCKCGD